MNEDQVESEGAATRVVAPKKSIALALVLTFFFGPLGLFYSSFVGGLVMLLVSIALCAMTFGVSLLLTVPICMIWGAVAASNHNKAGV